MVSSRPIDCQLEGEETEHDHSEADNGWDEVLSVIVVLSDQVVAWKHPDSKKDDLVEDDSSVNNWVIWDTL